MTAHDGSWCTVVFRCMHIPLHNVCLCECVCKNISTVHLSASMDTLAETLIASVGVCESTVTYIQPFNRSGKRGKKVSCVML